MSSDTRKSNNQPTLTLERRANANAIIGHVAVVRCIPSALILGPSREASIVRARHEAMAMIRDELKLSYWQIGSLFDRCHDVVIRGIRRHKAGHPKKKYERRVQVAQAADPSASETAWIDHILENFDVAEQAQARQEAGV